MALLTVQLNHRGPEKKFRLSSNPTKISKGYYRNEKGEIIREWNKDILPNGKRPHYRKFIKNIGEYIDKLGAKPKKGNLLFWGEWEGHSIFHPINKVSGIPNGIHEPFHSIKNRGHQNTDPYIFGDYFKYAICLQTGIMNTLDIGSLILFGTTTDRGFQLDTVFVVKSNEPALSVRINKGANYTDEYKEETLDQLCEYLQTPSCGNDHIKLYKGQTFLECDTYFSFVPCKVEESAPFGKLLLDYKSFPWLSKCKQGHPYNHLLGRNPIKTWNEITNFVLSQEGFCLGVRFVESVTKDMSQLQSVKKKLWYKVIFEKNYFESFDEWHNRKYQSIAVINPNGSVSLDIGGNRTGQIVLKSVKLSASEEADMIWKINDLVSDPLKAQTELKKSSIVSHISHVNPIKFKIEQFDDAKFINGVQIISYECNAMFIENGLLKQIETLMKIVDI